MKTESDDRVKGEFPLKNGRIMAKLSDFDGVGDNGYSKKVNSQPRHLGSFILWHSKRLMNDAKLASDGFKKRKMYYSDTDSMYIHKNDYDILKEQGLIGIHLIRSRTIMGTLVLYMVFSWHLKLSNV